jgi:hypothetical protein
MKLEASKESEVRYLDDLLSKEAYENVIAIIREHNEVKKAKWIIEQEKKERVENHG